MPAPTPPKKKPYEKPRIVKVDLRPEEAVLGNCKTSSSAGPGQGDCETPASCFDSGS